MRAAGPPRAGPPRAGPPPFPPAPLPSPAVTTHSAVPALTAAALSAPGLARFAEVALENVARQYPFHLVHLARSAEDVLPPRSLHPAFHGSYDWHSSVHMHWSLARLHALSEAGGDPAAATNLRERIGAHLDARLTPETIAGELAYFESRGHAAFERPYGWAWLLALSAEFEALARREARARAWCAALEPLAALLRARFLAWLPRAHHPNRAGTHGNTAFALALVEPYAAARGDGELREALAAAARRWYGHDEAFPAAYEPSGDDFLSGGLCEALACARLMPPADFDRWWQRFQPDDAGLARWSHPVDLSDPADPKIVHLAGLNLSRAWCWRELAPRLPDALRARAAATADAHVARSLAAATSGDYVGTHWLATFALLALTGDRPGAARSYTARS